MVESDTFRRAREAIASVVPGFRVDAKVNSRLHRAIGWVLGKFGVPLYMSYFWTTPHLTAYHPIYTDPNDWEVLFHEGYHAHVHKRFPVIAQLLYILNPCRFWVELRGYSVQLVIDHALGGWGDADPGTIADRYVHITNVLSGPEYLYALPCNSIVRWFLRRSIVRILEGRLSLYEEFARDFAVSTSR